MSSLKDSGRKRGILTGSGKSKEGLEPGSGMPTSRRVGRRSIYLKVGRKRGDSGQYQRVEAAMKRMGW